ncbi:hypothetical protein PENTCL1PPCAC_7464, partial [Pristionchus entomophagus]
VLQPSEHDGLCEEADSFSRQSSGMASVAHDHGFLPSRSEEWTVEDDVILISSIINAGDIDFIAKTVKFSKKYTISQLEKRWFDLLYDEEINSQAKKRLSQCMDGIEKLQKQIPLSLAETFMMNEFSATHPTWDDFERLL